MIKTFEQFVFDNNSRYNLIKPRTNFYLINESQGSKSMSQAIKLVMNTWGWDREKAEDLVKNKIRTEITPLKEDPISKFTLGVTRMYCDNQISDAKIISDLNATLKLLSAHVNEYDKNLNGLSADELISKFQKNRENDKERKKREIKKLKFGTCDYEIVKIDSYNDAKNYYKYTNPNSRWCLTYMENMYNSYTCDVINQIYFCLKNGFEDIKPVVGENAPLDEYGLSMISIIVNEDEELAYCTCRWNHDNEGTDSVMDEIEVSKVVNVDFFETFKPNNTWKDLLNNAKQRLKNGESPEDVFDYASCRFAGGGMIVKLKSKYNFIDKNGEYLSDKWFEYFNYFREGYAVVELNGKWNFIDDNGEYLSDKWFDYAYSFSEGYAAIELNEEFNFIDINGKILFDEWFENVESFCNEYARVQLNGKWNFINKNGEYLSDEWFDDVEDFYFYGDFTRVKIDDKYNLINVDGKILLDKWVNEINDFENGFAIVELDYKYNLINDDCEFISDEWFDEIGDFEDIDDDYSADKYAKVKLDYKYNLMNRKGELLSDEWFDKIYDFDDGRALVELDSQSNFIDINGKLMLDEWVDETFGDYIYDYYVKVKLNNQYNFINKKGEFISDEWFDDADSFNDGYARVQLNGKYNLINEEGELLSDEWFDEIDDEFGLNNDGFVIVKLDYKYILINAYGELIYDEWFDEIYFIKDEYIVVGLDNKGWNVINLDGEYESDEWFDDKDDAKDYLYDLL